MRGNFQPPSSAQERKPFRKLISRCLRLFFFLAITITCVAFSFVLSFKYNSSQHQSQWAVNWIKLTLQDLLLSPFISVLFNYCVLILVIQNQRASTRIQNLAQKLINESFIAIRAILEGKQPKQGSDELPPMSINTVQVKLSYLFYVELFSHSSLRLLSEKMMDNYRKLQ